jgi:hypothetical protein
MSNTRKSTSVIKECDFIRQIYKHCTFNTTLVFDIDNTIQRPHREDDLGSDQCYRELLAHAFERIPERPRAFNSVLALNSVIQSHIKVKPVEPETPDVLRKFQDLEMTTIAVTARGIEVIDVTLEQMRKINVRFSRENVAKLTFELEGRVVTYINNILFCNGVNKGVCLAELERQLKFLSKHVVMLDDVEKNLIHVMQEMEKLDIQFTGLRYNLLDKRVTEFKLQRAIDRLLSLQSHFSHSTVNLIETLELSGFKPK